MYIIASKQTNKVLMMGENLDYLPNGYPILTNEGIAFPSDDVLVSEDAIPSNVEPEKWCYTKESGFYPNLDYHEADVYGRVGRPDVLEIEANYTAQLIKEGVI